MSDTRPDPPARWPAPPPAIRARTARGAGPGAGLPLPIGTGGWGRPPRPAVGAIDPPAPTAPLAHPGSPLAVADLVTIDAAPPLVDTDLRSAVSALVDTAPPLIDTDLRPADPGPPADTDLRSAVTALVDTAPPLIDTDLRPADPGPPADVDLPRRPIGTRRAPRPRPRRGRDPTGGRHPSGRRRRLSVLAELAVACLIVAIVGATTGGGHGTSAPPGSLPSADSVPPGVRPALMGWGASALPLITALVDDLIAAQRDASSAARTPDPSVVADVGDLRRDLDRARRLPPPPDRRVAASWSTILGLLARGGDDLARSVEHPGAPDDVARAAARSALATAGKYLSQLAGVIG